MLFVGQYGIRKFQASDIREEFAFSEYVGNRVITCAVMLVISLAYCFYGLEFKGYSLEKFLVVFLVCILKLIQAFADVIHGRLQQNGRLDIAAKASFYRTVFSTVVCMVCLVITSDLFISVLMCVAAGVLGLWLTSVNVMKDYGGMHVDFKFSKMKQLMIVGGSSFLSSIFIYVCEQCT